MTQQIEKNKYIEEFIKPCVDYLYTHENMLFENGLSERCIAFRLAHHLQNKLKEIAGHEKYFVDCDYNSRTEYDQATGECVRLHGKQIKDILEDRTENVDQESKSTGRFIDIIVHKRTCNIDAKRWSDLFCLEIKTWFNKNKKDKDGRLLIEKDKNNLRQLTSTYGYKFGFHLIFGKTKNETKIEIFKEGESIGEPFLLF